MKPKLRPTVLVGVVLAAGVFLAILRWCSDDNLPTDPMAFAAAVLKDPLIEWRYPINFWGKVVDENGRPVAEANVRFTWNDLSPKGTSTHDATSDSSGLFSLLGRKGKRLYVVIEKPGYYQEFESAFSAYEYAAPSERFHPDPKNPVVFRLKKAGEWEPLLYRGGLVKLSDHHSRLILNFDNVYDKRTGPVEMDVWCDPQQIEGQRFDWSFTIKAPTGGVVAWTDDLPGAAPEIGYQPELKLEWKAGNPDWQFIISPKFYFKFGSPARYGRLQIMRYAANGEWMQLRYWVNPSGSRNLEAEPAKSFDPLPQE